jgi:uncharacterized protein
VGIPGNIKGWENGAPKTRQAGARERRKIMHTNPSRDEISNLLRSVQTVAVVGLSDDPRRPSFGVARELRGFGLNVLPVNPNLTAPVLGEEPYASLREIPTPVDVVDVFRRPEHAPAVAREAVEIGARILWMQLGVVSEEAAAYAGEHGLTVVMDRCLAVDYRNLCFR